MSFKLKPEEERQIIASWVKHPGTELLFEKMQIAAEQIKDKYDTANAEQFHHYQVTRKVLLKTIPDMIERVMNVPDPEKKRKPWKFWEWFPRRVSGKEKGE